MEATRDFETLRRELETLVSLLKANTDPEGRKRLLREIRLTLIEADQLISLG